MLLGISTTSSTIDRPMLLSKYWRSIGGAQGITPVSLSWLRLYTRLFVLGRSCSLKTQRAMMIKKRNSSDYWGSTSLWLEWFYCMSKRKWKEYILIDARILNKLKRWWGVSLDLMWRYSTKWRIRWSSVYTIRFSYITMQQWFSRNSVGN